jgi:hypothetical protein
MIGMLAGALVFAYLVAGAHFLRFWRRTGDRLFVHFAFAFWLFALDQLATSIPNVVDETDGYEYLLRVLGFVLIIVAIVDKNFFAEGTQPDRSGQ